MSFLPRVALLPLLAVAAACSVGASDVDQSQDELTSLSARSRKLTFEGYVYVAPSASDGEVLSAVRTQTQTAFGALRTSEIGVNSRELRDVDPKSFVKTSVNVIDPALVGDKGTRMMRVKYTYIDDAVVPVSMARRSSLPSAVMGTSYRSQTARILTEGTANDSEAREFSSAIWYVFEPRLAACKAAMATEQAQIDAERAKLTDKTAVPKSEATRLYLPITVSLGANTTNTATSYPEYDRLYAGGVEKNKLVISMVNGFIDHGATTRPIDDSGYSEWLQQMRGALGSHKFTLTAIEPKEGLASNNVRSKKVTGARFEGIISWHEDGVGFPSALANASERDALEVAAGAKVVKHWLTFEAPVTVTRGGVSQSVTIKLMSYFGAEGSPTPHKYAIKNSDVFLYNGHSSIGYGPLDPKNFSASDFPSTYQIFFIDGCVSYNYYEKDYLPLKVGGTKNLDLITNGLEAPAGSSGMALGRFVAALVGPKPATYRSLLKAASATDSLRVVDGELDNTFSASKTPMTVSDR